MSPGTTTQNDNQVKQRTVQGQREPEAQRGAGIVPAQPSSSMPAGVALTVTPQIIDGQLFLHYILENQSEETLLTDILRLRLDAPGLDTGMLFYGLFQMKMVDVK